MGGGEKMEEERQRGRQATLWEWLPEKKRHDRIGLLYLFEGNGRQTTLEEFGVK
jgi:hypothetical protein